MVERADVTVRNRFPRKSIKVDQLAPNMAVELNEAVGAVEEIIITGESIKVDRLAPDRTVELNKTVGAVEEVISLPSTEGCLKIYAPEGMAFRDCRISVDSVLDVQITSNIEELCWTVKLVSTDGVPEVPTTVNVEVGSTEP